MKTPRRWLLIGIVAVVVVALVAVWFQWNNRPRVIPAVDSAALREAITTDDLMAHIRELERIADANDGNRQAGTPGYEASMAYVEAQLKEAGYETRRQEFSYERSGIVDASLAVGPGGEQALALGEDFQPLGGSGSAAGRVTAVDVNLEGDRRSSSGCQADDFEGFPAGDIALLQRGSCTFLAKTLNAREAGASAVVVFNQGDADDRTGVFMGQVQDADLDIPVVTTTYDLGVAWATQPTELTLNVEWREGMVETANVLADLPGTSGRTVVVGAHLDGVSSGAGINDNGSGVAVALEVARHLAELGVQPEHGVRFAFWSGEEDGLWGSTHYVSGLDEAAQRATEVYLNLDMVGSPNPTPYVYAGFGERDHPVGKVMADHLREQGAEPVDATFEDSDHRPFLYADIPVGGLFTGAYLDEGAGVPDPCYHESCDRADNIDADMLGLMADTLAHGVLAVARPA